MNPDSDQEPESLLARIDKARALLLTCRDAPEAKVVANMAKAAEVFARRQKSKEARLYAHAVYVDAVACEGGFLERAQKNSGGRPTKTGTDSVPVSTLRQYGISKNESSLAQLVSRARREAPELFADVRDDRAPLEAIRNHFGRSGQRRRRIRFSAFDDFGGELTPVAAAIINDCGGVLSKSAAKAKGRYARNRELWDDTPTLAHPSHNKIYNPSGEMPDTAASALHDMGLISDGHTSTMWSEVQRESHTARTIAEQKRAQAQLAVAAVKLAQIETLSEVQVFDQFLRKQSRQEVAWILTHLAWRHGIKFQSSQIDL
jgi:hypothetical protein